MKPLHFIHPVRAPFKHSALALAIFSLTHGTLMAVDNTGTGGTITYTDASGLNPVVSPPYIGGYVVHTFTSGGTLDIPLPVAAASSNVLVVAGGGQGGWTIGGGGGAGGLIYTSPAISAGATSVTVGLGGTGGGSWLQGGNGGNSSFGAAVAIGGGGGGGWNASAGLTGGSGGGAAHESTTSGPATSGQGNIGGTSTNAYSGGGGGAGAPGANGAAPNSGAGGAGLAYSISGTSTHYAGGGGGGGGNESERGLGGIGGGGAGSLKNSSLPGENGVAGTGGGGGGGSYANPTVGGNGGSGIVIVRYPYDPGTYSITLDSPTEGQSFGSTLPVSATTTISAGTAPYEVKFYLDSTLVSTTPSATSPLTVNLGLLPVGAHTLYTTVTDNTSTLVTSATHNFTVALDTAAPNPNPMTFAVTPAAQDLTTVVMTATVATDALTPPVQYYFENTTNSTNSGWQSSTTWTNTGLTTGTTYSYRVKARDGLSNETAYSAPVSVIPSNDPVTWDANGSGAGQTEGGGDWLGANQWWNGFSNVLWNNSMANNAIIGGGGAGGTITLGTVSAGSVAFGSFSGTYTLSGGGLTFNTGLTVGATSGSVTISTPLDGAGGITKSGPGTLEITGLKNNTYSGGTVINSGTLLMYDVQTFSGLGTGTVTLNGGIFYLQRNVVPNNVIVNGGSLTLDNGFSSSITGTITLNAPLNITAWYVSHPLTGAISGSGGITLNSLYGGGVTLSGTNTYTGPTTVTGGELKCNSVNALGGGALSISGGKLNLVSAGTKSVASLTLGGVAKTVSGTYGSVASGATFQDDTYFTTGSLGTVTVGGSGFADWADTNAPGQTPDQDHDNDGVENGLEYFMGQSGSSFTAMPGLDGSNTVNWPMIPAYNGTYEVQTSPDLGTWTNVIPKPLPAGGMLTYTLPSGLGTQFVRLLVTPAP